MDSYNKNEYLTGMLCGRNFAYLLNDPALFSNTDYRILQSDKSDSLIKTMKMLYNGKIELLYLTENFDPLSNIISSLTPDSFIILMANVFSGVCQVKENGFLRCENIDISMEHIYVDTTTYKTHLLYVPLTRGIYLNETYYENELRATFSKLILGLPQLSTDKTIRLLSNLQNVAMPIKQIIENIVNAPGEPEIPVSPPKMIAQDVRLVSLNTVEPLTLIVNKDNYIIGRSIKHADGIIRDNMMVGRKHCRVNLHREKWECEVEDLNSSNGTYVNNIRVPSGGRAIIRNDDVLRLANIDFKVVIR